MNTTGETMQDKQLTAEEKFRSSLEDVATVVERLALTCSSFEDMVGMIRLAVGDEGNPPNQGQLRLLMRLVNPQVKR